MPEGVYSPPRYSLHRFFELKTIENEATNACARIVLAVLPHSTAGRAEQSAAAYALLEQLIDTTLPKDCGTWRILREQNGAPRLCIDDQPVTASISMAHSGPYLMAGLCINGRIGVDVERYRVRRRAAELATFLGWAPGAADTATFLRRWTLWEASAKSLHHSVLLTRNPGFHALDGHLKAERLGTNGFWHGFTALTSSKASYSFVVLLASNQKLELSTPSVCTLPNLSHVAKSRLYTGATIP